MYNALRHTFEYNTLRHESQRYNVYQIAMGIIASGCTG